MMHNDRTREWVQSRGWPPDIGEDARGSTSIEYLILIGVVGLATLAAWQSFSSKVEDVLWVEGEAVRTLAGITPVLSRSPAMDEVPTPGRGNDGVGAGHALLPTQQMGPPYVGPVAAGWSWIGNLPGRAITAIRDRDRSQSREGNDGRSPDRSRNPTRRDNSWLANDWAGREILSRYLSGGKDWHIRNDKRWTDYMTANRGLTDQVSAQVDDEARALYQRYLQSGETTAPIDVTFHANIENGEGINGYQYLHGTNDKVGDFHIGGNSTIVRRADGGYDVYIDGAYEWNDIIDPNDEYATDQAKNKVAELITLGQADPYKLKIEWHKQTTIHLDANGRVIGRSGWPD